MSFNLRKAIGVATLLAFAAILVPQCVFAEDHVVMNSDLQQAVVSASQIRQGRVTDINQFFASEAGKQVLKQAKVNPARIQMAVPMLSDDELARLDSQVKKVQNNFAGSGIEAAGWAALAATVVFTAWWLNDQTFAN